MKSINCGNCGKMVNKKVTDIKRNKSGKMYCSRSCSASANNKKFPKRKMEGFCGCGSPINKFRTYCDICLTCEFCNKKILNKGSLASHINCCKANPNRVTRKRSKYAGQKKGSIPWNKGKKFDKDIINNILEKVESGKYKFFSDYTIRRLVRKYLINKHGNKCMLCGLTSWLGVKLPLVCDHIDGNPNNIEICNFRIICNNCDSILPTFKGKNKGRGRKLGINSETRIRT